MGTVRAGIDVKDITGAHRSVLYHEMIQAAIVTLVVLCATILVLIVPTQISSDLLSFVFGGAISYAGGRASSARQALQRQGDSDD
jgi:hypothetical protein